MQWTDWQLSRRELQAICQRDRRLLQEQPRDSARQLILLGQGWMAGRLGQNEETQLSRLVSVLSKWAQSAEERSN